jgi:hypothetical protein
VNVEGSNTFSRFLSPCSGKGFLLPDTLRDPQKNCVRCDSGFHRPNSLLRGQDFVIQASQNRQTEAEMNPSPHFYWDQGKPCNSWFTKAIDHLGVIES